MGEMSVGAVAFSVTLSSAADVLGDVPDGDVGEAEWRLQPTASAVAMAKPVSTNLYCCIQLLLRN
jgi:hypothetical protein